MTGAVVATRGVGIQWAGGAGAKAGPRTDPSGVPLAPTIDRLTSDYYAAAQGKQGAALLGALHEIIRNGHTDTGYAQARDGLFAIVSDPTNTDTVADVYTGRASSGVSDRKTAFQHGLNTEHTWPQSLGARGIAQSDLHQLLPANIEVNAKRGNLPYGKVTREVWNSGGGTGDVSKLGYNDSGQLVFEPRPEVRGDIARGMLYFFTRYNRSRPADYTLGNFTVELPTLLRWAHDDPVTPVERERNDAVFSLQHNRNPFIDHPEWIDGVDFPNRLEEATRGLRRRAAAQAGRS